MPEEVFVLLMMTIPLVAVVAILKYKLEVARLRNEPAVKRGDTTGSSLTTSELEQLIERAVSEAVAGLEEQLDEANARLKRIEKTAPVDTPRLSLPTTEYEGEASAVASEPVRTR